MVSRADLLATLAAIQRRLDNRVQIWRVILNPDGSPTGQRIFRGSFTAPPDCRPPTLEELMKQAKGRRD